MSWYIVWTFVSVTRLVTADNIISATGPVSGYTGAAGISVGWTDFTALRDVTITAPLANGNTSGTAPGTAFLTTSIGPGTTLTDVVAKANIVISCALCTEDVVLFSGLDLGPGSYWLTLSAPAPPTSFLNWAASDTISVTTSLTTTYSGFTYLTDIYGSFPPGSPLMFPPVFPPLGYEFSVTSTPEPSESAVICLGLTILVLCKVRPWRSSNSGMRAGSIVPSCMPDQPKKRLGQLSNLDN